jgi:hypothetical protein
MNSKPDRPPILRFLLMFAGLLTLATALAALSHSAETPVEVSAAHADSGAPSGPSTPNTQP